MARMFPSNKALALASGLLVAVASAAAQAPFPSKPVTLVSVSAPGGNSDNVARSFSEPLAKILKVPVIVESKPGAGGTVAGLAVLKAASDGHVIMSSGGAPHVTYPLLSNTVPYDVRKDFKPVALLGIGYEVLVVRSESTIRSVADLIAEAKRNAGQMTFGSPGLFGPQRLAGELFQAYTGTKLVNVPNVRGSSLVDLLGGHIDMLFEGSIAFDHVRSGKLRALAVTSLKRLPDFPDVPTLDELGLKGYEVSIWHGAFVSAATSDDVVTTLNRAIVSALQSADVAERYRTQGLVALPLTVAQFRKMYLDDYEKWEKVISQRGLKTVIAEPVK